MASPVRLYQEEMHANLGFFPTWLPGDRLEVGDVGLLDGGRFRRMASLTELQISYETVAGTTKQNVQYNSSEGTKISSNLDAVAGGAVTGQITLEFSQEGAFVFHVSRLQPTELANRVAICDEILKAYENRKWKKEWVLVESVHSAECATIIISQESSAGLVLSAKLPAPLTSISLADPKVSLSVTATRGKLVHILGERNLHPLYSCLRLNDPLFGSTEIEPVRGAVQEKHNFRFLRPSINALLNS